MKKIDTFLDARDEALMEDSHLPMWECLIDSFVEESYAGASVLDFGCNRGGFLRLLYYRKIFKQGSGVDIAVNSLEEARKNRGELPIDYFHPEVIKKKELSFDYAFSYEVLYLLENLKGHFHDIFSWLKPGGIYYACTGCHTSNPLWERWRREIQASTELRVQDYSPDDFAAAAGEAGFGINIRALDSRRFMPFKAGGFYPSVTDQIRYFSTDTLVFRFTKGIN